jgi:DNA invertase Pin-like site-specific DNA recombinase
MNAAIYARKSTEQAGVADDQKSVARQLEHSRQYAERKGWTVAEEHVYVDDGISGAEFANRPGFLPLLSLTAFADELERENARQRTYDAMLRKAKAGHATGGGCCVTQPQNWPLLRTARRHLPP